MKRLVWFVIFAAFITTACGSNTLAPTPPETPKPVAPTQITYAINLPDAGLVSSMQLQYPHGVTGISPVEAQARWDYSAYYDGSPNVYAGPTAPLLATMVYKNVGILIAPILVASKPTFLGSEWSIMSPTITYEWIGQFAYAKTGPGISSGDPNPTNPTCTPGPGHPCLKP